MDKGIVKKLFYTQFVVYCVFLLNACISPNQFSNDQLRQVHTFADERNTEGVISYLNNENSQVRSQSCILLGSMNDSLAIEPLLHAMEFDKEENVRISAAFALGQYQLEGLVNLMMHCLLDEKNTDVKREIIIAIGKSGGGLQLAKYRDKLNENLNAALAEGLFYSVRKKPEEIGIIQLLIKLTEEEGEARFYAASALGRIKSDISTSKESFRKMLQEEDDISTRSAILRCLVISSEIDSIYVFNQFQKEENYLCRLAILRGITTWKSSAGKQIIIKAIQDKNFHIRETAADYCLNHADLFSIVELEKAAKEESHPRAKYTFYEALLSKLNGNSSHSISNELKKFYSIEKDEYIAGFILKALASDFSNLSFIEEECFNTNSILIREFSFEALLKIRSDKRFPAFAIEWKKTSPSLSLEDHFAHVILDCIATYDVSLVAMGASYLRDTTLLGSSRSVLPIPNSNTRFLETAMGKMRLPRDIESYGELLKTLRLFEGHSIEGSLKPEMNHPIDWDLVERIPENQQIEIITDAGNIRAEIWVNDAPGTVANFVQLIQDSFYLNKRLHRVVPGFVIQDGCPRGDGYGSTMQTIRSEFTRRKFDEGVLGMASSGPDTESCQWFITHTRTPHLNGRYTAFGQVISGMDIVHQLGIGAHIKNIVLLAP